ncbi:MAG: DUF3368 domain-containing protein [Candidatus Hodarchaeota archaeon]
MSIKNKKRKHKPLIFNASPLIYFCKVGFSEIFNKFIEKKFMTPKVAKEVVEVGKKIGAPDAFVVEQLIKKSIINISSPKNKEFIRTLEKIPDLHEAEIQVLALAKEIGGIAILDEGLAREIGTMYGIDVHGSAYLLIRLYHEKFISRNEAKEILEKMIAAGWRLSVEEYSKILKEFE